MASLTRSDLKLSLRHWPLLSSGLGEQPATAANNETLASFAGRSPSSSGESRQSNVNVATKGAVTGEFQRLADISQSFWAAAPRTVRLSDVPVRLHTDRGASCHRTS